ncbi:MAG: M61 family metallopeptidase [Planctomycetes bacterium]|nr:M61 family metallopeptidase [Planctomycetota bacterium]
MRRFVMLGWVVAVASVCVGQDAVPPVAVHYVVDAAEAGKGTVGIEMEIRNLRADEVTVAIPAWRPGSYRLLDYGRRVRDVTARAGGIALDVRSVDKQTWKVTGIGKRDVTLRYRLTPDRVHIGPDHYFLEGPGTYFYVVDRGPVACTVRFKVSEGWGIGTALEDLGDGLYGARDYDTFADCPVELGKFESHAFVQDGVTYELVVHSIGKWDSPGLLEAIKGIAREQCRLFGGAPFDRYVFIYHFNNGFGGAGLEHLNSTDIALPQMALEADGRAAAGITSHEFFHAWNVKRIRPEPLGPFDYTRAVRTRDLWFCEGVTSYYGELTLARARLISEEEYFRHLADEIEMLQGNPLRRKVSVAESSWTVWDRKPADRTVDYYNKGELLGWLLDLRIRALTAGEKSLDDVMRLLYERYVVVPAKEGKGPIGVGYPEGGLLKAANEVSGGDFSEFFKKYVEGTEELPYEDGCKAAGLSARLTVDTVADLGSPLRGVRVESVPSGSGDEEAGLKAGDRILEVAGQKVTGQTLRRVLRGLKPGVEAAVKVKRGDEEITVTLTPIARERTRASVGRSAGASSKQKKLVDDWLHVKP